MRFSRLKTTTWSLWCCACMGMACSSEVGFPRVQHPQSLAFFVAMVRRRSTAASMTNNRTKGPLCMGLYDSPLPPPPPKPSSKDSGDSEETSDIKEVQMDKNAMNAAKGQAEEESLSSSLSGPTRVFSFRLTENDAMCEEVQGHLPPLPRDTLGFPLDDQDEWWKSSPYQPDNDKVQHLMEMTSCHAMDVAVALRAFGGSVPKAFGALSKAQKFALETSLAGQAGAGGAGRDSSGAIPREELLGPDEESGEILQQERRQGKQSGIPAKTKAQETFDFLFGDTDFATDEPDAPWLPGKPNPRPIDDEPWFTG